MAEANKNEDLEDNQEKLKYPRSIPFIISNEFCERFNFYGMKTILVLYLTRKLFYDDDTATILYHTFNVMVYFFCIFGAIIADSWLGKYLTILYLSIVYAIGSTTVSIGAIESLGLPAKELTIIGLILIALGSGGIKPCVSAFGGEQFKMPQQAAQLAVFFSLFYFAVNAGSLISTTVTPILREDVKCFGVDDCFPLAFGVPAILMVVSIMIFIFGKFLYKIVPPAGNMFVKVCKCIGNAISTKRKEKRTNQRENWLDYAEATYGKKLVLETKILLNVLVLFLPLPFFWALFDQQGSRWTFQATRMSGDIGFMTIKPDQMQVVNPLLILVFIPLYEVVFYPLLSMIGIRRPLQKLTIGGILAGVAFLISAFVELNLQKTYAVIPGAGEAQMRIFNGRNCDYTFTTNIPDHTTFSLNSLETFQERYIKMEQQNASFTYDAQSTNCASESGVFDLIGGTSRSFFLQGTGAEKAPAYEYFDNTQKSRIGWPKLRILANILSPDAFVTIQEKDETVRYNQTRNFTELMDVPMGKHQIFVGDKMIDKDIEMKLGGVYTLVIQERQAGEFFTKLSIVTDPNSMNILWLIPQYVVMTLGEVMYSVTGLTFSFTQAPESMKSVLQGCWMLTIAFGNLIVVIIGAAKIFDSQANEFFLFAGLMFVDMVVFMFLARRYKAIPLKLAKNEDQIEDVEPKLKYPRAIPFIVSNEFCERFNYYGMRTILVLYLTRKLAFDEDTATVLYHAFTTLVYFCCIIGAIIADSWLGKFKTIFFLSCLYAAGSTVIAVGAIESLMLPATALTLVGLLMVAFGSGGIKPCVAAFGGEQFKMPQQAAQLAVFFSLFYFAVNSGSLVSTSVTPILREDVHCFGMNDCFPLAFGVPAILMIVSILIFVSAKFLYKVSPPSGNMFLKVCKCVGNAVSTKRKEKHTNPREHWLDYAENAFGKKLVMETKILMNVLVLYLPLPFFWALFDQQGSRWTFQATRMDGDIGFMTIKPDQMQVVNPFLILVFIPVYEVAIYPLLKLVGISRPLQKLTIGGILAGVAFILSALVEISLEPTYAVVPGAGEAQLRIFNGIDCAYTFTTNIPGHATFTLKQMETFEEKYIYLKKDKESYSYSMTSTGGSQCPSGKTGFFELESATATSYFLESGQSMRKFKDSTQKSSQGTPLVRILANLNSDPEIALVNKDGNTEYNQTKNMFNQVDVPSSTYELLVGGKSVKKDISLKFGGVFTIVIQDSGSSDYTAQVVTITEANSLNMLWLTPQYVVMTLGEVMFSVTGLQFSFTQAPESMKSVLQGCWQLTVAFGNLIIIIIAELKIFDSQKYEFALFAVLMFVDMAIFAWLAYRFQAIPLEKLDEIDEEIRQDELKEKNNKLNAIEYPGTSETARSTNN
ncbi:unnamed protein product [Diamesa tonsa]